MGDGFEDKQTQFDVHIIRHYDADPDTGCSIGGDRRCQRN